MKITLKSIPTIVFTVLCFCGISFATTIDFNQSNYNVNIGDSFSADLGIAGLGDMSPDSLGVFDIDVIYDSTILSLSAVTFGDPVLGDQLDVLGLGSIASATPSVGSVNVYELSLDLEYDLESLQAGAFTLFSLNFDTIAEGNSALTISINSLGDSLGAPLQYTFNDSNVSVRNPVPEPGTFSLIIIGLLCSAGLNRRKGIDRNAF